MKRTIIINYEWWRSGRAENDEVKESHVEALEESADSRIGEMMKEGFTSGELLDNIRMDGDSEDGVEYSGWWSARSE